MKLTALLKKSINDRENADSHDVHMHFLIFVDYDKRIFLERTHLKS